MARVVWSNPAIADLTEVTNYIALDKPSAADKLAERVFAATAKLGEFPNAGRVVPEWGRVTVRELIVGPCRVIYTVGEELVVVIAVVRGEQQLQRSILPP
jgi:plasmid stabilization system protein ParE